ncbi:hypothetical protein Tco_0809766 [Tanacetum coccineum]
MSNQLEDIQAAGSDTHSPMLDRTDFESWQQRIRDEIATGLPRDIYKLINHNTDVKDIWDNVKMLLEGSELTKDDRESQLYDEFEHFGQHKGENIHDYYVRFTKLINDMRHIKMTMPKIQLNSKFVNNRLPEWGRFVMAFKLNRGLKESNHDQLYAYLKQHESHANKNKMLKERLNQHSHDPLALVSNVSPYQYPSSSSVPPQPSYTPPVTYQPQFTDNTQLDTSFSPTDELLNNLTKQGRQNRVQGNNTKGVVAAGNGGLRKMLLMQAQENGVDLDEKQLLFLAADQCDAFDSDVDEAPTAQTMFMANLSSVDPVYDEAGVSYDFDTLSEVQDHANCLDNMNESHEEYEMHNVVQPNDVVDSDTVNRAERSNQPLKQDLKQKENKLLEEFLDMKHLKEKVKDNLYKQDQSLQTVHMLCKPKSFIDEINNVAIGYKNPFYMSKAKQVQPALYNGHEIVKANHARLLVHDSEDTLEIAETTRKQMLNKMKDPECVKKKVKIAPHDYSKENYLATFTPQKQLTPEQIFWSDDLIKIKAKALKEKAKSAKPVTAMTVIQKALINEIKEMKEVFDQMEAEVDQNAVDKKCDEIKRKNLLVENGNLIAECLSKDVFYTGTNYVLIVSRFSDMHDAYTTAQKQCFGNKKSKTSSDAPSFESVFVIGQLQEKLQGWGNTIRELKEKISRLQTKHSDADPILDFKALDSQNKDLNAKVNALQDLNECFSVENKKIKQHYKELYDSIQLTHAKTIEKTTSLLTEIETLKA